MQTLTWGNRNKPLSVVGLNHAVYRQTFINENCWHIRVWCQLRKCKCIHGVAWSGRSMFCHAEVALVQQPRSWSLRLGKRRLHIVVCGVFILWVPLGLDVQVCHVDKVVWLSEIHQVSGWACDDWSSECGRSRIRFSSSFSSFSSFNGRRQICRNGDFWSSGGKNCCRKNLWLAAGPMAKIQRLQKELAEHQSETSSSNFDLEKVQKKIKYSMVCTLEVARLYMEMWLRQVRVRSSD